VALAPEQTPARLILIMALGIVRYTQIHEAAVAAFNERARANSAPFELSKTARPQWLPRSDEARPYREHFLALDTGEVRGGFTLRCENFWLKGDRIPAANYQGPLSEGLWDRRYMMAGVQMLRAALREEPRLYALGMGSLSQPLPKLLASSGWSLHPVPFRFKVLNPSRFLRHIRPLRRKRARAWLLNLAAFTGLGALVVHVLQRLRTKARSIGETAAGAVTTFGAWADDVWVAARDEYAFAAVRDRHSRNVLFGDGNEKNIVLHCTRGSRTIGWSVVRSTPMRDDQYFGDLRVGSLVDLLAVPDEEANVVELATRHLEALGSDLVVTNQSHRLWLSALQDCGYLTGPSNFIFACSPALASDLGPLETALPTIHFNRADGDGPIHL
jgi:hypothetical protein